MNDTLYDTVAVNHKTQKVRILGERKTLANAEAIERMAIFRRWLDEEFYAVVPTGKYKEGDTWDEGR